MIPVPDELRGQDVEVIILPLDENGRNDNQRELDKNGYPIGFFEETSGSLADDPIVRAPQGEFDMREEIV